MFITIKDLKEILIVLAIIIVIYHFYLTYNVCAGAESLDIFTFKSDDYKDGDKTILIVGGTHGNEPAGYYAVKSFMNSLTENKIKLKSSRIILIPQVNYCALKIGLRFIPEIGDLNRKYPIIPNGVPSNNHIKKIIENVAIADFILDFHEGWGFNRLNGDSMGSTITPTNTVQSMNLSKKLFSEINKNLNGHKRFRILTTDKNLIKSNSDLFALETDIKGSLRFYCNILNKDYILIETTGQNNIQELSVRVNQNLFIINYILKSYNLI